jgi:hypothetical protein
MTLPQAETPTFNYYIAYIQAISFLSESIYYATPDLFNTNSVSID